MGTVYLAHDRKHDRRVALKVLAPELARSLGTRRFHREISIAARLSHPHIAPLHESGQAGAFLYYTMPFIEGGSLRDRLNAGPLPVAEALGLGIEVADALGYAHGRGIVHRDVKPENILLPGGHAVIVDFGIARAISAASTEEPITETGLIVGTASYVSPEQAAGEALDGRSDLYSLGCVVYEMLAGDPPYGGASTQAVIARHLAAPVPDLCIMRPEAPPSLAAVLRRALAKAPGDRFSTAGEMAESLREVLSAAALH